MDVLTVATLNLEDGASIDLLPDLAAQAGQIDLLLFQEGKNWHRDGQRTRFRAERLLNEARTACAPPSSARTACARVKNSPLERC